MNQRHRTPTTNTAPRGEPRLQYAVRGEGTDALEIDIYDAIGESMFGESTTSARGVRDTLKAAKGAKAITVRINSAGGEVTEGMAIYALLKDHPARVTVRIDALAASIASIVAMAGDDIVMAENAFMMIHNPWGMVIGNAEDMRSQADLLDKMRSNLVDIYAARTGQHRDVIDAAVREETWMTAAEALALGYCTAVVPLKSAAAPMPAKVAAAWNLAAFASVPDAVRALAAAADAPPDPNETKAPTEAAGGDANVKEEDIKAAIEAIKNGDGESALAILEAMIVAGVADPDEGAPGTEPASEPDAGGAAPPDPMAPPAAEASAALAAIKRMTGKASASEALDLLAAFKASHVALEAETAKLAKDRATIEASERRRIVGEIAKKIGPGAAWADPTQPAAKLVPASMFAAMSIADLRDFEKKLTGSAAVAVVKAPAKPASSAERVVNGVELTAAEVASVTKRAKSFGTDVDAALEKYASIKARQVGQGAFTAPVTEG